MVKVIKSGEAKGPMMLNNDNTHCFYKFKYGLSKTANPNILTNENGIIQYVIMHIQRTLYECLQDDSEHNAIENKTDNVDVVCSVGQFAKTDAYDINKLYENPFRFWMDAVERK